MVILQDPCKSNGYLARSLQVEWLSCKILASRMVILQDSCKSNGYLARFLQDDGYLARSCKKILQDDASSCKILQESCKILQDNHSISAGVVKIKFTIKF